MKTGGRGNKARNPAIPRADRAHAAREVTRRMSDSCVVWVPSIKALPYFQKAAWAARAAGGCFVRCVIGFTSAYECQVPATPPQFADRDTIVAIKRQVHNNDILSLSAKAAAMGKARWSEEFRTAAVQKRQTPVQTAAA